MRRLYMAFAALIAGGMITAGGNAVSAQNLVKQCQRPIKKEMIQKRTAAAVERMPQLREDYSWNGTDWELSAKTDMKYDADKLLESIAESYFNGITMRFREIYSYNDDGLVTEQIGQGEENGAWQNYSRLVYEYDAVRKDVKVLNDIYNWDFFENKWVLDEENEEGFFYEIERDDQGRVTKNTHWLNSAKTFEVTSNDFSYDITQTPGKVDGAISMTWNGLNDNYEIVPMYFYENIVWQESDKQYINIIPNVYYAFDEDPNNKILAYTLYDVNADGTKGAVNANYKCAYDDKGRLYYVEINFGDGGQYQGVYKLDQDANGSYELNEIMSGDFDGSGSIDFPSEYIMNTTVVTRNDHGDIIKEEVYDVDASFQMVLRDGYAYDYVYNEEDLLSEVVFSYYTTMVEGGSWENISKILFSNYTDGTATGIKSAEKGEAGVSLINDNLYFKNARGSHYIISDMSGKTCAHGVVDAEKVSIGNLPDGMYIVKVSGKNCNNALKIIKK